MTPLSRAFLGLAWFGRVFGAALCAAACGDSVAEADGGDPDGDAITTECGTYDPDDQDDPHAVPPQDPASEGIVDACQELCSKMTSLEGCTSDIAACRDDCRMRSCHVCPGTLVPLARCQSEFFDASACRCDADGVSCELPPECQDEEIGLKNCGG